MAVASRAKGRYSSRDYRAFLFVWRMRRDAVFVARKFPTIARYQQRCCHTRMRVCTHAHHTIMHSIHDTRVTREFPPAQESLTETTLEGSLFFSPRTASALFSSPLLLRERHFKREKKERREKERERKQMSAREWSGGTDRKLAWTAGREGLVFSGGDKRSAGQVDLLRPYQR